MPKDVNDLELIELSEEELNSMVVEDDQEQSPSDDREKEEPDPDPDSGDEDSDENRQTPPNDDDEDSDESDDDESDEEGADGEQKEVRITVDGEEYDQEKLESMIKDLKNDQDWKAKNTKHSEDNKATFEAINEARAALLEQAETLLKDDKVMDALDEYYGKEDNPLREMQLDAESLKSQDSGNDTKEESPLEKRIRTLEEEKAQRELEETTQVQIAKDIDALKAIDTSLTDDDVMKIAGYIGETFSKTGQAMTMKEAWVDLYGKAYATKERAKAKAKGKDKLPTASGKTPGQRKRQLKKPKDIDDATDNALQAYLDMSN